MQCKDKKYVINIVGNSKFYSLKNQKFVSKQITMLNFLFLTMLSLASLASAQECLIQGRCVNSQLIHLTGAGSATDCLQDCKDFPGCQWYSFKERSKTICELFSDCNEISTNDCDHCVSGQVQCDLINCNLPGYCTVSITRITT